MGCPKYPHSQEKMWPVNQIIWPLNPSSVQDVSILKSGFNLLWCFSGKEDAQIKTDIPRGRGISS